MVFIHKNTGREFKSLLLKNKREITLREMKVEEGKKETKESFKWEN